MGFSSGVGDGDSGSRMGSRSRAAGCCCRWCSWHIRLGRDPILSPQGPGNACRGPPARPRPDFGKKLTVVGRLDEILMLQFFIFF